MEKYATGRQPTCDNVTQSMGFECWVTKATNKHSEYVLLLALPLQQWFRESASLLRNKHIISYFFLWRCGPTRPMASTFLRFLDHTQRRIAVGRTPLDA